MTVFRTFFYHLLALPLKLLVKCKIVSDSSLEVLTAEPQQNIFYIVKFQSASDLLALQKTCKQQGLPDPLTKVTIRGNSYHRTLCLAKTATIFPWPKRETKAAEQGLALIKEHGLDANLDIKLVPVNLCWGRSPGKEKANMGTLLADDESPNWLRKFFIVLFLGRDTLVRFSQAVSLRYMFDNHGADTKTAHKLLRVARVHFYRQTIAATGPRLMTRKQMFTALLANPSIKRLIEEEAKHKKLPKEDVKKLALEIMHEIAGDYRDAMIRYGESVLGWLWNRLYNGIEVKNADRLRTLAQEGHEIIYVPCHRSHMDYLLLTYVIYQQGLVTPRIAAGINLNFWPAGTIFRKAGAFFIRRSFGGNRLYSTIFREYLGLLFSRGYPVKYYTEGGRSRTGRILAPKTGMLAMTIQSLLKGIERPLTLVPVYIGYEHVMEVGSYHNELKGSSKQKESMFGVVKAIKKLRNYGKGYVSFGEPLTINTFLNKQVPHWRDAIDAIDPQKPSWLTPTVNVLANKVMVAVNKTAALNPVSLLSLVLLTQENFTLAKQELVEQLNFLLKLQRQAPFSPDLSVPVESGEQIIDSVIALNKVDVIDDVFGQMISFTPERALENTYYRNNILHTFVIPSLVARLLETEIKIAEDDLIARMQLLTSLIAAELFLWQKDTDVAAQVKATLNVMAEQNIIKCSKANFWSVVDDSKAKFIINNTAAYISETLQRYAIVLSLFKRVKPVTRGKLETDSLAMAKRLSAVHNINGPEFVDKKALGTIIHALREHEFIVVDSEGCLTDTQSTQALADMVFRLIDTEVFQTIEIP